MIRVVRIAGESYDLETGASLPKQVVLSNGYREVGLPVDDERVQDVLAMAAEISMLSQLSMPVKDHLNVHTEQPGPEPGNGGGVEHVKMTVSLVDDVLAEDEVAAAAYEPEPDEEYEPGEEYNDPTTGVGSL